MNNRQETHIVDDVLSLLDIITIILVTENPILDIALVALLKTVTNDRLIRILFILFIIVLGKVSKSE